MEKKFRQTIYVFKLFTPSKKYRSFSFIELTWAEVSFGYCNKDEILKIRDKFYIFSHEIENDLTKPSNSLIIFKDRGKDFRVIKV